MKILTLKSVLINLSITLLTSVVVAAPSNEQLLKSHLEKVVQSCRTEMGQHNRIVTNAVLKCIQINQKLAHATEKRVRLAYNQIRPLCLSNSSDPDGDGYGWENGKTCIVNKSKADKGYKKTKQNFKRLSLVVKKPILILKNTSEKSIFQKQIHFLIQSCNQMSNRFARVNASCLESSTEQMITSENRMFYALNNGRTYCKRSDSDPDGDGYGWENGETCIVFDSVADKVDNYDVFREIGLIDLINNCPQRNPRATSNCFINGLNNL